LLAGLIPAQAREDHVHLLQSHEVKAMFWMRLAWEAKHAAEKVSVFPK
jgi:hypothetical protein